MSYDVNDAEYANVVRLAPPKRYEYLKCCDWEEVWSVKDSQNWRLMGDAEQHECIPVWPARRYAAEACVGDWEDCIPEAISVQDFVNKWIPGLIADHRSVAVFPMGELKGIVRKPEDIRKDIEQELQNYA
ncbi:MAG: DUF2750 domain-containing protein [Phycisphaerae bacterium]|nr:DUF2750 domain-containing protein [Phycisphaerae bacterium]